MCEDLVLLSRVTTALVGKFVPVVVTCQLVIIGGLSLLSHLIDSLSGPMQCISKLVNFDELD